MGIEKRLEEASRHVGYPEDGPSVQTLARDALSAIGSLKAKLTASERELAAARAEVETLRREFALTRDAALELAARISDEYAAENLRMAMDSIHLDPALARGDFSAEAQKMTDKMQAHGAHHAGAYAGCEQVARAIRAVRAGAAP